MQAQHRVGGGQIGTSGVRSAKCSIACTAAMDWGQLCGGTATRPVRNTFVQFNSPRSKPRGGGKLWRPMLSAFQAHIVRKLTCMTSHMPPSRREFPLSQLGPRPACSLNSLESMLCQACSLLAHYVPNANFTGRIDTKGCRIRSRCSIWAKECCGQMSTRD
jgi:hypothetical protein